MGKRWHNAGLKKTKIGSDERGDGSIRDGTAVVLPCFLSANNVSKLTAL